MLPDYDDITSRIPTRPQWYDGNGVPRYAPFEPRMMGVYDQVAVLAKIRCQDCRAEFLVGEGWSNLDIYKRFAGHDETPEIWVWREAEGVQPAGHYLDYEAALKMLVDSYHYGDPPRHGCVGDTMNSEPIDIVEAWSYDKDAKGWGKFELVRFPAYEGPVLNRWQDDHGG